MAKFKVLVAQRWDGRELRETVKLGNRRFRITTGLRNGGGGNIAQILGESGWAFFLGKSDVAKVEGVFENTCYVSGEGERKGHAQVLNEEFKKAITKIFEDEK